MFGGIQTNNEHTSLTIAQLLKIILDNTHTNLAEKIFLKQQVIYDSSLQGIQFPVHHMYFCCDCLEVSGVFMIVPLEVIIVQY